MYFVRQTKTFDKSLRKIKKSGFKTSLFREIDFVVNTLAKGAVLPISYKDHGLHGEFAGCRECHVRENILLMYKIEKDNLVLVLIDIGSHSQLFG